MAMRNTTLCYIENRGRLLLLHRIKKASDENSGKWIGVGGKFEAGESPDECLVREVKEETGITLKSWIFRGVVTFVSDEWGTEYMHLFTASVDDSAAASVPAENNEGTLAWIPVSEIDSVPTWDGDRIFLKLISENRSVFLLKLSYTGDRLSGAVLNGEAYIL